jgi:hypothetical protein
MSWQDDSVTHQTIYAIAELLTSSDSQVLQVKGVAAGGIDIAMLISARPTVALGTSQCGSTTGGFPITAFSYTVDGVVPLHYSCTVSMTALGAANGQQASGTFSAMIDETAGGTKAITAGVFNVTLNSP